MVRCNSIWTHFDAFCIFQFCIHPRSVPHVFHVRIMHPHAVLHPRRRWQRPDGLPCLSYQPLCSMPPQMAVWVPPIPPDWRQDDCSLFPADPSIVKPGHTVVLSVSVFARTQRCQRASAFCIHPPFCIHRFYVLTTVSSLRTKRASTICIHTPFCILVCTVCTGRSEQLCIHPALCASTFCRSLVAATAFKLSADGWTRTGLPRTNRC